jgi:hypothetical protein
LASCAQIPKYGQMDVPATIDVPLVAALISEQFPRWSHLPITQVQPGGWDNRTFRLGDELSVRLPSTAGYVLQVEKEQRWLPILASQLPLPVPEPVGFGQASERFPFPWSVYRWLPGRPESADLIAHDTAFAADLGDFLTKLQRVDASGGPLPGAHNFFRGDSPAVYDAETRRAIAALGDTIDATVVGEIWDAALSTRWEAGQSSRRWRTALRRHRLRHVGNRRSRLRPRDRLDDLPRGCPRGIPRASSARLGYLGPSPRLGDLEGADRGRRSRGVALPRVRGAEGPAHDRRGDRRSPEIRVTSRTRGEVVTAAGFPGIETRRSAVLLDHQCNHYP